MRSARNNFSKPYIVKTHVDSPQMRLGVRNAMLVQVLLALVILLAVRSCSAQDSSLPHFTPKRYWSAATVTAAATYADAWSTVKLMRSSPTAYEAANPWLYGHRPTALREYSVITGELLLASGLSYRLRRYPHLWWIPLAASTAAHSYGALHNVNLIRVDHGF